MAKKESTSSTRAKKSSSKTEKRAAKPSSNPTAFKLNLLADQNALDPQLSSLFAKIEPPVKPKTSIKEQASSKAEEDDEELSALDSEDGSSEADSSLEPETNHDVTDALISLEDGDPSTGNDQHAKRKRRRRDDDDNLEEVYADRLAREEAKELNRMQLEHTNKRQRVVQDPLDGASSDLQNTSKGDVDANVDGDGEEMDDADIVVEEDSDVMSPPPRHETETKGDLEHAKANRTVFLGNVSTGAISSKASRKTLLAHLSSICSKEQAPGKSTPKERIESIRFRSTPYASAIPKKAAFAKKELMDATTKSTNAYVVYSSQALARAAVKKLNGTVVLDRHLRVDEVAHPAPIDNRRCVFIGNLGFVDDESNIRQANEDEGREKRKPGKEPADIEEGLWRVFGRCGTVESVRVIRDSVTRVGKGIAYVQFTDENGVEAALLYNEKKFPPMLPRKLRVSRAKAQKRNAKPGSGRPTARPRPNEMQRKMPAEQASKLGRAGKLLGRAGAAQLRKADQSRHIEERPALNAFTGKGIQRPENFVFEGHRATARQGKAGLKLGGRQKKSGVTKRSAAFKSKKRSAAS